MISEMIWASFLTYAICH